MLHAGGDPINTPVPSFSNQGTETDDWSKRIGGQHDGMDLYHDAGDANLSGLSAKNDFSSPDGLWFSRASGICWIQTDDGAITDETNCMLLAAVPGQVGDGGRVTVCHAGHHP